MSTKETIKLTYPIEVDGVAIESIALRRPCVRDMLIAEKGSEGTGTSEVTLFANLSDNTPEAIEKLDLADYAKVQKVYKGFLS